jgi:hypothetical protein
MTAAKITLAQTLSGDWVLTTDNPFEDGFETELARFETSATAAGSPAFNILVHCLAKAANTMARELGGKNLRVRSHSSANRDWMTALVRGADSKAAPIHFH